eukprot:760050_1
MSLEFPNLENNNKNISSLPSLSDINQGMRNKPTAGGVNPSYPVVDLGDILYPNRHDLRNRIQLFCDDDSSSKDDEDDNEDELIRSRSHDRLCQIHFENESETEAIHCYWIGYDSTVNTAPHTIPPLSASRLNCYISHPFIISTSDALDCDAFDTMIGVYIPRNGKHLIHHVTIDCALSQIDVTPFEEDIKPRCKCGRILQHSDFDPKDDDDDEDTLYVCFGCDREIGDGDRVWMCDNLQIHALKIYCLSCAQQRSHPLGIILAYRSDMDTDYCCNEKYRNYPRNFPRLFQTHMFVENTLRIVSLATDLLLAYVLVQDHSVYKHSFFNHLSDFHTLRLTFTLLPGFILSCGLFIYYCVQIRCCKKNEDDDASEKRMQQILEMICVVLTLISLIFLYKLLMIGLCLLRIVFVVKRVRHGALVSSDVEMKQVLSSYPLLYDEILSAWPLLVISLVQLIHSHHDSLVLIALFSKVIASTILMFVDIDRLRLWRYSMHDPHMLVPVCILHTSRPYPMRSVQLTSSNAGKCCVMCGDVCHDYVWLCAHLNCNGNTVCTECTFQYLGKYQQDQQMDDESFYELLLKSTHFRTIYSKQIAEFGKTNELGNVQRHCWSNMGGWIWCIKAMYNLFVLCLLLCGCWIFQKVWLIDYFNIAADDDAQTDITSITTIYGSLFLCVAAVFELILVMIQCTFLMPNSSIEASVPRIIFNLFFVFYLFGFSLLLFDYQHLSAVNQAIKWTLVAFSIQLAAIPFQSIWQIISSNLYLWQ